MTAITITEISTADLAFNNMSGTSPKRRIIIAIRGLGANADSTLDLDTYVPNLGDIEGTLWSSTNSLADTVGPNWSSTRRITFQNAVGGGALDEVIECGLICNIT